MENSKIKCLRILYAYNYGGKYCTKCIYYNNLGTLFMIHIYQ